jgi:hypothetical protein
VKKALQAVVFQHGSIAMLGAGFEYVLRRPESTVLYALWRASWRLFLPARKRETVTSRNLLKVTHD